MSSNAIWPVFEELAPPLFLERKIWFEPGQDIPGHCDVLVIEAQAAVVVPNSFRNETSFSTIDHEWNAYVRTGDR